MLSRTTPSFIVACSRYILYTHVWTACCAVALFVASEVAAASTSPDALRLSSRHLFIYAGACVVYNAPYVFSVFIRRGGRGLWRASPTVLWERLCCFSFGIGGVAVAVLRQPGAFIVGALAALLPGLCYSLPLLPSRFGIRRLRDHGLLKIITLTGVWTFVTAVLPILASREGAPLNPWMVGERAALMFALCLTFDLRDQYSDHRKRLRTIPVSLGRHRTYLLIALSLLLFVCCSWFGVASVRSASLFWADVWTVAAAVPIIGFTLFEPHAAYYLFFVDGIMVLNAGLTLTAVGSFG